jgi:WhiB family transcriptional regulator, redox-sensing transcriptional regulator
MEVLALTAAGQGTRSPSQLVVLTRNLLYLLQRHAAAEANLLSPPTAGAGGARVTTWVAGPRSSSRAGHEMNISQASVLPDAREAPAWDEDGWRRRAACRNKDPEIFFPIGLAGPALAQIAQAKATCVRCPVRAACLRFAVRTRQAYGIWGGLTEEERLRPRPRRPAQEPGAGQGWARAASAADQPRRRRHREPGSHAGS